MPFTLVLQVLVILSYKEGHKGKQYWLFIPQIHLHWREMLVKFSFLPLSSSEICP